MYKKQLKTQKALTAQTTQLNDIKTLNQKAQQAQADAEAANQAKSRYLSGISHELRTPLNVIMGYAQLLESQAKSNHPKLRSYQLIRQNCEHLTHLIEGLLEFSAIEAGKLTVQSDTFDIKQTINQLTHMFEPQAKQKGLAFKTSIAEHLPQFVKTDKKRLQQILNNLLSNAIKFTNHGKVELNVTYRNQVATFAIQDTGCGIEANDIERIFQPFERIESPQRQVSGTGLGLTITQLLAELLGAELTVHSTPQKGSLFTLKIMLSAQTSETHDNAIDIQPLNNSHQSILLVDDVSEHRELVYQILAPLGFDIKTANGAATAKEKIKKHPIDLAILDVAMPQENGWQLAEWIRANGYTFKIMMLSANPRDNNPQRHKHHQAYLSKPIQIQELLSQINQLLNLGWAQSIQPTNSAAVNQNIKLRHKDKLAIAELADIGHVNGIQNYLENMYKSGQLTEPELVQLTQPLRQLNLKQFSQLIGHGK